MLIGIDASRAFIKNRTGIEEYSYQVIENLKGKLSNHHVVLYLREKQNVKHEKRRLNLPKNWKVKIIKWPKFWTQIGLSLEILFHSVDVLFIPAHTVPIIHPRKTIVTIHGLEYEFYPKAYSWWERFYMRQVIKNSCCWASKIIAVSKNTKRDLIKLYKVPAEKIRVIYEGHETCHSRRREESRSNKANANSAGSLPAGRQASANTQDDTENFLLFIGRLEKRKNITGIIKAFEILKEKYNIPHKLVLAGGKGYGFKNVKIKRQRSKYKKDIILTGYIPDEEKWKLLKNAEVFLFPTFYEGFGLPILEAQSVGIPVVAGNNSSIVEIVKIYLYARGKSALEGNLTLKKGKTQSSALLVNPHEPQEIAEAAYKLISNESLRNDIIRKGYSNIKRFSWEKCAREIAKILTKP